MVALRHYLSGLREAERLTLILWSPAAISIGIGAYFALKVEPPLWLFAALGAGAVLVLCATRVLRRPSAAITLVCLVAMGAATAKWQVERVAAPILAQDVYGPVSGRFVGLDRSSTNRMRILLDEVHIPGLSALETPAYVRIVLAHPPQGGVLAPGQRVMLTARLSAPGEPVEPGGFDFRRHAWFLRLGATGFTGTPVVMERPPGPTDPDLAIFALRRSMAEALIREMPARTGGFAAAILTGDRSGVDPADLEDLRNSNLAHLLAISGLHMGLLTGAVFLSMRILLLAMPRIGQRLPAKKIAAICGIGAGAAYLALSGGSVATQRAFIMVAVVFLAVLFDRPALTLRAVALAGAILLITQPAMLLSAGFQMSFAATTALIAAYGWFSTLGWWRGAPAPVRFLLGLLMTSAIAGAATAPFGAFHFNRLPLYGLIANLAAVPVMGFLVMPASLLALIAWPFGQQGAALWVMDLGIAHILAVASWVSALEGAALHVAQGPTITLALIGLGGWALAVAGSRTLRGAGVLGVVAGIALWATSQRPDILVAPMGQLVGIMGPDGRALDRGRGGGFPAQIWLENDGDGADQRQAAARWDDRVDAFSLAVVRKGEVPENLCAKVRILVAPEARAALSGPCIFIGQNALSRNGAYGFYLDRLDRPITTREQSGHRPWTKKAP